jgi:alginate O-acetyltransferase complex protein AlgI
MRVFFRAKTLTEAATILGAMLGQYPGATAAIPTVNVLEVIVCMTGLFCAHWYMRDRELEEVVASAPRALVAAIWVLMAFAVTVTQGSGDAFIYFQF